MWQQWSEHWPREFPPPVTHHTWPAFLSIAQTSTAHYSTHYYSLFHMLLQTWLELDLVHCPHTSIVENHHHKIMGERGIEKHSSVDLPFFGRPRTPVLEWRSFSDIFFSFEGDSGLGQSSIASVSSGLGCLARRRALCLGLISMLLEMTFT